MEKSPPKTNIKQMSSLGRGKMIPEGTTTLLKCMKYKERVNIWVKSIILTNQARTVTSYDVCNEFKSKYILITTPKLRKS